MADGKGLIGRYSQPNQRAHKHCMRCMRRGVDSTATHAGWVLDKRMMSGCQWHVRLWMRGG